MGTTLQYSVNLIANIPKNSTDAINTGQETGHFLSYFENKHPKEEPQTGFDQLQESMDMLLEQCNREIIRNTMLKHEEVFKDQVHELHRLYRVQKSLMSELKNNETKLRPPKSATSGSMRDLNFNQPSSTLQASHSLRVADGYQSAAQTYPQYGFHQYRENDIELTLSIGRGSHSNTEPSLSESRTEEPSVSSRETFGVQRVLDLDRPVEGGLSDQSHVSRRLLRDCMKLDDIESDIKLTLSIGRGSNGKKSDQGSHSNTGLKVFLG
ncbi:hypothetical protein QJS04_geneDACA004026 [Acorus gramineus]|uniref:Uncharacterized protein n=1 Tax=Acorus gramineus TaxID=55184 RepID=A0AAV9BGD1_ACOGR|nr:hypothetical protein QJS04_geneDACA004026 [Acorus gramineus]